VSPGPGVGARRRPSIQQGVKVKPTCRLIPREAEVIPSAAAKVPVHIADARGKIVPIYRELSFLQESLPTEKTKEQLDKTKEHMDKGNNKAAIEEPKAANVAVFCGEIELPLLETWIHG